MSRVLKNIFHGMGSIMNIYPCTNYRRNFPQRTDTEALRQDWKMVGNDLKQAIKKVVNGKEGK